MAVYTLKATLGREGFATVMSARSHTMVADEPKELGGQDLAPDPYEHLMGALASCTVITMRMYADRKGWPLEGVELEVAMTGGTAPSMARTMRVLGELDDAQRQRLLEIADACPVSKMLKSGVTMTSALVP